MGTTESILAGLRQRAEAGEDVRQQIIAHETLARLRKERAAAKNPAAVAALDEQIRVWRGRVDVDADPPRPAAGKSPKE